MRNIYLAFIWHMHQPLYRRPGSHDYMMPWVRLHAVKDYLDMVDILSHYPRLKQTFNLVPSLLEQIEDYASGQASDAYLRLSQKPVEDLSPADKTDILSTFFDLNWEQMVQPFARYRELAALRSHYGPDYAQAAQQFSPQDWLDLTTWFNLAWIDPHLREREPELHALEIKGRNFSATDRSTVLKHHQRIVQEVIPAYRRLQASGQIELTTTPYYHPILPLLSDTQNIQRSRRESAMPRQQMQAPEDARWQLNQAQQAFQQHFGMQPQGLWPSEQALSADLLPLIAEAGFSWVASSEGILWHSLNTWSRRNSQHVHEHALWLYRPYQLGHSGVQIVFRDIYLSDLIGFQCWKGDNEHNAELFYQQIKQIQRSLDQAPEFPYLITIALDGENCWEYYQKDGHLFLNALYQRLSADQSIESVTVSEYLERFPAQDTLQQLHPGSWINSDFSTWSGDPTKNYAWDLLIAAREMLVQQEAQLSESERRQAWELLYTAEGSDWFWWFGEGHSSAHDHLFDAAFRTYLQGIYTLLQHPVPEALLSPLENQVHSPAPERQQLSAGTMQASQEGY
ncbi:MAG: glycoside hydrolase [Candidatus Sericytochromatia bacterium]|nr:glycoside hydrolase [Candidatus Sericytochromatia bacterium]